ncbi:MAG TPA: ABC transporter permease [Streptosporangiaceae bacterium]|nr:ABC transporter permease [Streptosporangiaceae bacterium]
MILGSFLSEWTKLKRKTLLLSTFLGLAAASSLFVILIFSNARAHGTGGGLPSLQQLARPNGLVFGLTRATFLLGVVAFGLAAAQMASEYSLGTLRQLLVRQPRRVTLLTGKMIAVVIFMVLATAFAAVIAFIAAIAMAQSRGVPVSAWFTGTGLGDLFKALGNIELAVTGYSVLGLVIGQFLRSAVAAVIVGFAWLLVIEQFILTRIVPSAAPWLPGISLSTIAGSGNADFGLTYGHGLIVALVYIVLAIAAASLTFTRRDVTA